jgi:quinol monooxygenase YgiN
MLTIFFHMTSKPGCEDATTALVAEMTRVSRSEDDGCIRYVFHREQGDPLRWVLYEQWRDRAALKAHMANMKRHFGDPPEGAKLPAQLHALVQDFHATSYDVVE